MMNQPEKWRGGYEDFTKEKAPLVIWDIPNGWLDSIFRRTERKELLKDTLCWAMGADLIEGIPELDDDLFNQMIIPVRLADTGKRAALRAGGDRVVAWMSGLSEGGVQVKYWAVCTCGRPAASDKDAWSPPLMAEATKTEDARLDRDINGRT